MSFRSQFTACFSRLNPGAGLTMLFLGQTVATAVAAEMRGNNPSSEGLFLPKTASLKQLLAEKATQSLFPHACTEIRGHDFSMQKTWKR